MRCRIVSDTGEGPWFVQSWYQDAEHFVDFVRGSQAFKCQAVAKSSNSGCRYPVTPGASFCRFHGAAYLRGSNPVVMPLDGDIWTALKNRHRHNPGRDIEDIDEAAESLGIPFTPYQQSE